MWVELEASILFYTSLFHFHFGCWVRGERWEEEGKHLVLQQGKSVVFSLASTDAFCIITVWMWAFVGGKCALWAAHEVSSILGSDSGSSSTLQLLNSYGLSTSKMQVTYLKWDISNITLAQLTFHGSRLKGNSNTSTLANQTLVMLAELKWQVI